MAVPPCCNGMIADSMTTAGTKIIADPEKCFQELISEKITDFIGGLALPGIKYRFQ